MSGDAARRVLTGAVVLIVCAPLAIVVTLSTGSIWRWIEDAHGIEAYGHSGPAEWCYGVTYLVCVAAVTAAVVATRGGRRRHPH